MIDYCKRNMQTWNVETTFELCRWIFGQQKFRSNQRCAMCMMHVAYGASAHCTCTFLKGQYCPPDFCGKGCR